MPRRQVRLDDDVEGVLVELAGQEGGSVALHANRKLRQVLGIHRDETDVDRPVQRASIGRSRAMAGPGSCPHPPQRRSRDGKRCMACGRKVPGARS